MAQIGTFFARRANFIPLSPARSRAGRTLYRMRGKDGAIHNSTPGPTGMKGTGGTGGPGCGARGQQRHHRLPNFARNLSWSFFETPQKHCNSNGANSMFEQAAGELRATLMGGSRGWPGFEPTHKHTSATRPHWCEGRRRVRRARAGFEIDHSERSSRVAISRAAGPDGARNTSGATSNTSRKAAAHGAARSGRKS